MCGGWIEALPLGTFGIVSKTEVSAFHANTSDENDVEIIRQPRLKLLAQFALVGHEHDGSPDGCLASTAMQGKCRIGGFLRFSLAFVNFRIVSMQCGIKNECSL